MSCQSRKRSVGLNWRDSCCEPAFTDHYMVLQNIGEGGFSQVKLACHLRTGTEVAVKVLAKVASNLPCLSEPDIMAGLDHPNVVHLFQVVETNEYIYLIMEHAGGAQLWDFIPDSEGMHEEEARKMFRQMVRAVQYCHQKGIVHLDLKPDNVMVDASGKVKLIDFGLSTKFTAGKKLKKFFGTLLYVAPEIVREKPYEGPPADIWSLGVVLYSMLTGRWPFEASNNRHLKRLIRQGKYDIPPHVSEGAQSLIRDILKVDPSQRPTIDKVMGHPWLTQGKQASSSPHEALPKLPDLGILRTMINMGYDHYNTWVSLVSGKFNDDATATYHILKHQRTQGEGTKFQVKPKYRLDPEDPPSVCHKFSTEPALRLSCEQQQLARSASVPVVPLCFLYGDTPPPSLTSPPDPVPMEDTPAPSLTSSPGPVPSHTSSQGTSTGQPRESSRGWKRVRRRIASCFRQLCCIPCFRGPLSRNKVAPVEMPSPDGQN